MKMETYKRIEKKKGNIIMKTKNYIWITNSTHHYQNVGNGQQVGFELSPYFHHALVVKEKIERVFITKDKSEYTDNIVAKQVDTLEDHANLNDEDTFDLIKKLKEAGENVKIDTKVIAELELAGFTLE